jgi:predicted nucleic acid-binding protein
MSRIVLDTDVASSIFKNRMPATLAAKLEGSTPVLTFINWAELTTWPQVRDWSASNRSALAEWMSGFPMLPGEKRVAELCGDLGADAIHRGRGKPNNDMWIAACCLAHDLPLATLNVKDFDYFRINYGLSIVTA